MNHIKISVIACVAVCVAGLASCSYDKKEEMQNSMNQTEQK